MKQLNKKIRYRMIADLLLLNFKKWWELSLYTENCESLDFQRIPVQTHLP